MQGLCGGIEVRQGYTENSAAAVGLLLFGIVMNDHC